MLLYLACDIFGARGRKRAIDCSWRTGSSGIGSSGIWTSSGWCVPAFPPAAKFRLLLDIPYIYQQVPDGLIAVIAVLSQRFVDDTFQVGRDIGNELMQRCGVAIQDGTDNVHRPFAVKRQFSRDHLV